MIGEVRKSLFETTDYVAERSSPWLPVGNRGDKKTRHEGRCARRHPLPRSFSRNDQSTWVRHHRGSVGEGRTMGRLPTSGRPWPSPSGPRPFAFNPHFAAFSCPPLPVTSK